MFIFMLAPLLGYILYLIANQIEKYTKLNKFILYIIFGFILGVSGLNIINQPAFSKPLDLYITLIALTVLMFLAGIALDLEQFKKSGIKLVLLGFVPIYIEAFIVSVITYFGYGVIVGSYIPYIYVFLLSLILAPTQLTIILPSLMRRLSKNKSSENNLELSFFNVLAVEGLATFPGILIICSILPQLNSSNGNVDVFGIIFKVILIIIGLIIMCALMFAISYMFGKLTKHKSEQIATLKGSIIYFIISVIIIIAFTLMSGPYKAVGVMFALVFAIGVKLQISEEATQKIQQINALFYNNSAVPIIFTVIGGKMLLSTLFNPKIVFFGAMFYLLAVVVRNIIVNIYLSKINYNKGERKYLSLSVLAKASGGVNIIPLIAIFSVKTSEVLSYLAIIELVIGLMVYGNIISRVEDKWLDHNMLEDE